MKISIQKTFYVFTCIIFAVILTGCKEKGTKITVLDGLPESPYLTEMKTSLENQKPVVVSFTAEWCPHCRKFKPTFIEVKDLYQEKVTFVNIDVDDSNGSTLSNRFQVRGIPTTTFVRSDGSVFKVNVGGLEKEELIKVVDELILSRRKKRSEPIAPFPIEPQEKVTPKEEEEAPQEIIKEEEPEAPEQIQEEVKPEEKTPENIEEPAVDEKEAVPEIQIENPAETEPQPEDKPSIDETIQETLPAEPAADVPAN
ncbi:MAG: hypothetical protein A3B68_06715 [Candidatus Melainabacteria bacterium RIFCSPHIGHO2_02_FULL_34_12]|nr:MAG: hypothetical protein A3B68_06715 [Candidatus Melainabacteria bacterium RIFCSPHIGHO2_02_FULL_34_12]